jgi:DNA-binding response OmpR family regulator
VAKILIVEDNEAQSEILGLLLQEEGFDVDIVHSAEDGIQILDRFPYDLLIVDWELPGMQGPEFCQRYRQSGGNASVLMLTGRTDVKSKAAGLDLGADDYVTKPYEILEVAARIRSLLRRPAAFVGHVLRADGIEYDVEGKAARIGNTRIDLTRREAALLEYLMRHPNQGFSAKALLDAVWPLEAAVTEDTVRSSMRHLRNKLASAGANDTIKTVQGAGYMIAKSAG